MGSTDQERHAELARQFFEQYLLPAAERLRQRGIDPLAQPALVCGTWYSRPEGATELVELREEDFAHWLTEHWRREGLEELLPLVEPLLTLARELQPDAEMTGEVSPFIYQMF